MSVRALLLSVVLVFLAMPDAEARSFGRNKVQYDTFDWQVLRTEHLEIHFYPEEEDLARRAAEYGEAACAQLDVELGHALTKRIPLVVYDSHYRFRQNNVSPSLVGESTGGFTEIFRTRVVLPYAGSEEDFRHVIHHELVHAYVFDRLYGGPVKSLFVLQYAFYIPLWFMEGIAEYYSNQWDSEAEMMIRDASVSGVLPPFHRIHGGYFVYKSGWSSVGFLVERYGDDFVRRVLDDLSQTRDLRVTVENVAGESLDEIGRDWLREVRRRTWPTLRELDEVDVYGRLLSTSAEGTIDSHAVLSPSGDRLVFLSNRSGTPDLWLASTEPNAVPRPLVRGARGGKFESLHPLHSSVGWSPDGKWLVAAAQKGARDALYVFHVEKAEAVAEFVPDLDAVERPDWSPADARFVFTGMRRGQVDLYTLAADGTELEALTSDLYEERGPRFDPRGERIVFASDRSDSTGLDLFTVRVATGRVEPAVVASGNQWDACWSRDGSELYYTSDEYGTRDLFATNLETGETRRLTRLLGGAAAPTVARAGGQLAFTAYEGGQFGIVLVEDPDTLAAVTADPVAIADIPWRGEFTPVASADDAKSEAETAQAAEESAADSVAASAAEEIEPQLDDYHPRFRPEWVAGAVGYGGFGFNAGIQSTISDVLGNHRAYLSASLFRSLEDSDVYLSYSYLPRRLDFSVSAFHVRDFLYDDRTTLGQPVGEEGEDAFFTERQWGLSGTVTYPLHTFRRIALDMTATEIERIRYSGSAGPFRSSLEEEARGRSTILLPRLSHTFDNTLWGWTGPIQGSRSVASIQHAIPLGGEEIAFGTALWDTRRYDRFAGEYVFAWRSLIASSFGPDPQEYQLGGPNTIRGYDRQSIRGRNAALVSAEFRYPFVDYVKLGWPFRTAFGGVRGNLFVDVGTAFDDPEHWRLSGPDERGRQALEDLYVGFGVGARARIAFLPIRVDVGWPTDGVEFGSAHWHFAIGPEY